MLVGEPKLVGMLELFGSGLATVVILAEDFAETLQPF